MSALNKAIDNSLHWYKNIFDSNSIDLKDLEDCFYSEVKVPPLFSCLATKNRNWKPDSIFESIDSRFIEEQWPEWTIKDSFKCLDLEPYGFSKLFDAKWLHLEKKSFIPISDLSNYEFKSARTREDLDQWIIDWGEGKEIGEQIFNSSLLDNPSVELVSFQNPSGNTEVVSLNKNDETVGVTNFFPQTNSDEMWKALVSYILGRHTDFDIVGYESGEAIKSTTNIGFTSVGNLSVWIKSQKKDTSNRN
jgi:hypothetical protein